jgi:hypothetical protein
MAARTQHAEARKLLRAISKAATKSPALTYISAARAIGRPSNHYRMMAQVCDLLDAAAVLANVPLLALTRVTTESGRINRKAFADREYRDAVIERSRRHRFSQAEFKAIGGALTALEGKGNSRAWEYVRTLLTRDELLQRLTGGRETALDVDDAINDLGSDIPSRVVVAGKRYARDPKVREAVLRRAAGRCEYCGEPGFTCDNGEPYLETHHIIALANQGKDRTTNVIALCAGHHREAHFGEHRSELEKEMIRLVVEREAGHAKAKELVG